jgi:hypothetical protein
MEKPHMSKPEPLQQLSIALPAGLLAFVQRRAEAEDRTLSGQVRHYLSEAARSEPPASTSKLPWRAIPNVEANAKSIAAAETRVAKNLQERERIARRQRTNDSSAADDTRDMELAAEIRETEAQIVQARRMMKFEKEERARANG